MSLMSTRPRLFPSILARLQSCISSSLFLRLFVPPSPTPSHPPSFDLWSSLFFFSIFEPRRPSRRPTSPLSLSSVRHGRHWVRSDRHSVVSSFPSSASNPAGCLTGYRISIYGPGDFVCLASSSWLLFLSSSALILFDPGFALKSLVSTRLRVQHQHPSRPNQTRLMQWLGRFPLRAPSISTIRAGLEYSLVAVA